MESKCTDAQINQYLVEIIRHIGDDPEREGLKETPYRIIKSWKTLFSGYDKNVNDILKTFTEGSCDELVLLKNVEFNSLCEHHWMPFSGHISCGYIPDGKVIGVSKIARIIEIYARRLQIQERLTTQIADAINDTLNPKGVMVVTTAKHLCMTARGVQKQSSEMVTSAIRGIFSDNESARQEFLSLCS